MFMETYGLAELLQLGRRQKAYATSTPSMANHGFREVLPLLLFSKMFF